MAMLPTEIIFEEILPKLPAKSLLRFSCVSKEFKTLISSRNFTLHHLRHSSATNRLLITNGTSGLHYYDIDSPENPPVPFPVTDVFTPDRRHSIIGCCHGLLLLQYKIHISDFMLINPSTGFYTVISCGARPGYRYSYGLGYDAINDDYKFVMLDDHRIVVANLKDKIWRKVDHFREDNVPRLEDCRQTVAVCDNHLCHWLRWCGLQNKHRIICFDLCMENWTQDIPWPDYNDNSCDNSGTPRDKRTDDLTRLQFMNGFLSVLTQNNSGRKGYDLWVMKEYGIKESWVKLCGFSDPYCSPLAFDRGSHLKVLCRTLVRKKERVKWYDVREKQYKNAEIHDIHFVKRLHGVCVVNGSLVSIPGGKRILDSKDTTNDTQIASQAEKNTRICL